MAAVTEYTYEKVGIASYKGNLVEVESSGRGMLRIRRIDGKPLWFERRHTHHAPMLIDYIPPRDPFLHPADCTCQPNADACQACRDWHNINAEEMPY